ncbi:antiholin-like protein LrgA [Clostridia bacterium]|nr:antiholin-like protein LrgA [Clostridia bacterium]
MKYIWQSLIIIAISCAGELMKFLLPLPIPAGVYGMVLLFALLMLRVIKLHQIRRTAMFLIEIMPLLFVPAGVGLMTSAHNIERMLGAVLLAVTAVTALVYAAAGLTAQRIIQHGKRRQTDPSIQPHAVPATNPRGKQGGKPDDTQGEQDYDGIDS